MLWNGREISRWVGFEIVAGAERQLKITITRRNASLKGRLLTRAGPMAGAQLWLVYTSGKNTELDAFASARAITDANGEFHTDLRPGSYHVFVTSDGNRDLASYQYVMAHEKDWGPLQLGPGENRDITLELAAKR
jgi:hypothetical protein